MRRAIWMGVTAGLLGGCSQAPGGGAPDTTVANEATALADRGGGGGAAVPVAGPQIAYVYRYGFDVPGNAMAALQDRHIALCDRVEPQACRVIEMRRAASDDGPGYGTLKLAVRAGMARAFGRALVAAAAGAGGTPSDSSIAAEDLSKQIVDTEARLRARQVLADRLTDLLRTRSGPVADLVAAERAVADVQEEIDAARSWLAEARARVTTSTFELSYDAAAGSGFLAPLREAAGDIAGFFGKSLALMILAVAAVLPWALLAALVGRVARRWRRRRQVDPAA